MDGGIVASTVAILLALKALLYTSYTSTDFEVHRNWLAITNNLPISQWYTDTTSEWTLDYPPFFAYFEKLLGVIARAVGYSDILSLQRTPLFNQRVLNFQRTTVVFGDLIFMCTCYMFCYRCVMPSSFPKKVVPAAKYAAFVLLISHYGLVIIDNIHFQYNAFLTSFVVLAIFFSDRRQFLKAAFVYCALLNFKHIYLYYAPAFAMFYLREYFELHDGVFGRIGPLVFRGLRLAGVMVVPFVISLSPFFYASGFEGLHSIAQRLFPISRGLTHAFWAPNFWALYNTADLLIYKVLGVLQIGKFLPPTYTSGLVQIYDHSVLPTISPAVSFALVVVSLTPVIGLLFKKKTTSFLVYLILSAYSFFFFGFHVHEKAVLLITVPLTVLAFRNASYLPISLFVNVTAVFSLFPLLFTAFEVPIKYTLAATYFSLYLLMVRRVFNVGFNELVSTQRLLLITIMIALEIYNTFMHRAIFGANAEFLPLMMISIVTSIAMLISYVWMIALVYEEIFTIPLSKAKCELTESLIKEGLYSVQSVESIEEVRIVAGIDMTASKTNQDFVVIAMSVYSFPNLELLGVFDETTIVTNPYIPDYFATREADPVSNFVQRIVSEHPELRPDVLFCDGNGQYHPRGCGLACHIGARTGIATIGVAKNFVVSPLTALGAEKSIVKKAEELITYVSTLKGDGYVPFDVIQPVAMNITRLGGSKDPVFVSAGYGIELDLATEIVIGSARSRNCEPIWKADVHSRERAKELFD